MLETLVKEDDSLFFGFFPAARLFPRLRMEGPQRVAHITRVPLALWQNTRGGGAEVGTQATLIG